MADKDATNAKARGQASHSPVRTASSKSEPASKPAALKPAAPKPAAPNTGKRNADASVGKKTCTVWYGYCPHGDKCTKKGAHLGKCYSEKKARQRIYDHLFGSPYHRFQDAAAAEAADAAELEKAEEEWDENWQGWEEEQTKPPKRQALQGPQHGTSTASTAVSAVVISDLTTAIQQQTRNAYIFVKAMLPFCFTHQPYSYVLSLQ